MTLATIIFTDHVQLDQYKNGSNDGIHFGLGVGGCVINSFVPVNSAISFDQDVVHCHKIDCSDMMTSSGENGVHDNIHVKTQVWSVFFYFLH